MSLTGDEGRPPLDLIIIYLGETFLGSFVYQPSRKLARSIEEICRQNSIEFDDCIFQVGDIVFDLQPTTLHKDLPEKRLSIKLKNSDSTQSIHETKPIKKSHPTKLHSLDAKLSTAYSNDSPRDPRERKHSHHSHDPSHIKTKNLTKSAKRTKNNSNNNTPSEPDRKPRKSTSEKSEPIRTGSSSVKAIRTQIDANEIKEKTIGAWSLPIRNSHLFGDLCRLASRISFTDSRSGKNPINYKPQDGLTNIQYAKQLLSQVISALESKESIEKVRSVMDQADTYSDGALFVGSVFQVLGDDCYTAKFLMATHQGIITSTATQLKVVLFSNTNQFTKDVQGKDGWRIELVLNDNEILISHFRKEQSMMPGNNEYSFEWRLDIYLNDFQSVDKILLIASNLKVGPNCDPALKQKIQDCLDQVKS